MADEVVGTARVDVKVNVDEFNAGIAAAKRQMEGFSDASKDVQKQYAGLSAAQKRVVDSLLRQANTFGMSKDAMLGYRIETKTSGDIHDYLKRKILESQAAAQTASAKFNQYGKSQKEIAAAMRGVPAQLTDIIVSLQSGQRPLTVLFQQGGQLKDLFGGVVPAAKALGTTFVGMISPATLLAAAIGGLGVAAYAGVKRDEELATAITMAGNAAGVTVSQLNTMVGSVGSATGSFSGAQDALAALAGNTQIASQNFELVAQAAVGMKDVTGAAIEDTIKVFAKLAEDPVKNSQALNEQYNYLTASIYEEIKALEDQGRHEDAAALAQAAYAKAVKQRCDEVKSNLNELGRAWAWLSEVASSAWRKMSSITQVKPIQEQIDNLNTIIGQLNEGSEKERLKSRVEELKKQLATEKQLVETQRVNAAAQKAAISFSADEDKYLTSRQKKDAEHRKNLANIRAEYESARKFVDKNGNSAPLISEAQYRQRIVQENARYREALERGRKTRTPSWGSSISAATMRADVSGIQDALRVERASIQRQTSELEAAFRNGNMSEADYYNQRRDLVRTDAEVQVNALEQQNRRLAQEKANGKDRINLNKQIAKNVSKMAEARADAATSIAKIDADETAAIKKRQAALLSYKQTLADLLATSRTQYGREEATAWMGGQASSYASGMNGISDRVSSERRKLQSDRDQQMALGKWSDDDEKGYQKRLTILSNYQEEAVFLWNNHWNTLRSGEENWVNGAGKAYDDYLESSRNVASQTDKLFGDVFSGLEDSLVDFCTTGEANFRDFATSILKDMVRIQARAAMTGLFKYIGSTGVASSIGSLFAASANGNVFNAPGLHQYSNQIVSRPTLFPFAKGVGLMGEAGPEAIMPLTRTSSGRLGVQAQGTAGAVNVVVNVSSDGTGMTKTSTTKNQDFSMGNALGRLVGTAVQSEMMNQMRPGGILWKWRAGRV
jgi:lambda family phage tail tape measure protein|nr:MAG TPA: tail length tape measure protein [Caudoviricetes sp.]